MFSAASYQQALDAAWQRNPFSKASITTIAGRTYSTWKSAGGGPNAGGNPGAVAIAYDSSVSGALTDEGNSQMRDSGGVARVVALAAIFATSPGAGCIQLADRISGISGFSGLTIGGITCNTVAPSRYASGAPSKGIIGAIEIYTAVGTGGASVQASSYTNEAGTAAQAGPVISFGATGFTEIQRLIPLPLLNGSTDAGMRSVEMITRVTATGTAGDYGVTTYKPLVTMGISQQGLERSDAKTAPGLGFMLPKIVPGACLFFVVIAGAASTGIIQGEVTQGEE